MQCNKNILLIGRNTTINLKHNLINKNYFILMENLRLDKTAQFRSSCKKKQTKNKITTLTLIAKRINIKN